MVHSSPKIDLTSPPAPPYQAQPEQRFVPLKGLITRVGQSWSGVITCLQANPLPCTLKLFTIIEGESLEMRGC